VDLSAAVVVLGQGAPGVAYDAVERSLGKTKKAAAPEQPFENAPPLHVLEPDPETVRVGGQNRGDPKVAGLSGDGGGLLRGRERFVKQSPIRVALFERDGHRWILKRDPPVRRAHEGREPRVARPGHGIFELGQNGHGRL
jgi:hypothetical protein